MNIPVLTVSGKTLAEAYEKALVTLYNGGCPMKTQYDKPGDPPSIDSTMNITVMEPWSDPMIHKFFIGGIEDLREYVFELEGLKDCICRNENDKSDTRWEYLYSSRLTNYGTWIESAKHDSGGGQNIVARYEDGKIGVRTGEFDINQVEAVVNKLVKQPHTRQAQMITWMPNMDLIVYDPPCLQSLHFRLVPTDTGFCLNTNIRFRSNDSTRAHFSNFFGFIQFIRNKILLPIQDRLGVTIEYGRINWQADSFHVYGSEIKNLEERLLRRIPLTSFEDRVLNFHGTDIQEMYHECEDKIIKKFQDIKRSFGIVS